MAAEAAVAAEDDLDVWPDLAEAFDQQSQDCPGVLGRVDVGRTKVSTQEAMPAENVQRKEAIVVVVSVEESIDLVAVNRIIGGVEVEGQFFRRLLVRGDEDFDEDLGDVRQRLPRDAVLQTTQRRRRSQRLIGIDAAFGHQLHQRIVA